MKYPRYVSIIVGYEELFWLVVWNMFYFSISYMGCHPSHWRTPSFSRGVGQPATSIIVSIEFHNKSHDSWV